MEAAAKPHFDDEHAAWRTGLFHDLSQLLPDASGGLLHCVLEVLLHTLVLGHSFPRSLQLTERLQAAPKAADVVHSNDMTAEVAEFKGDFKGRPQERVSHAWWPEGRAEDLRFTGVCFTAY